MTKRQAILTALANCIDSKPEEAISQTFFDILSCRLNTKTHPCFMTDDDLAQALAVWVESEDDTPSTVPDAVL